ncbi:MAG: XdhC family protein [Gammaproteobacteria bacterium]|nr:XdhC family protein [Gammaproteobacteria bacterium]
MSRSEVDIIEQGRRWLADGERVVLATVAHTWGSSPRPPGAVMVMSDGGRIAGSVSGGCIEEELLARVRENFPGDFETLEYHSDTTRSLPCGGRLLLTLEPLAQVPELAPMLDTLRDGAAVVRRLNLADRSVSWAPADDTARTVLDGPLLQVVYEPAWRLLVVGAGELAGWVCRYAQLLDYAIEVCEPRSEYREGWTLHDFAVSADYPDDFISARSCDAHTAIVALTHDPKVDDLAMLEGLRSQAFYLGALGSKRTTANRAARLVEHFGMGDDDVRRIRGPIGIDLKTRKPAEIALAVMTDITAARNGVRISTERLAP